MKTNARKRMAMSQMNGRKDPRGFTLIELMIVVAVIAILAAIAYPSYQDSIRKSRRADAKAVLLQAAQWMERFYTENHRYDQDRAGTAVALPLTKAPIDNTTKYYDISLSANCTGAATATATAFTLSACPISTTDQSKDKCKTLTLTNAGVKGVSGVALGVTADECWR